MISSERELATVESKSASAMTATRKKLTRAHPAPPFDPTAVARRIREVVGARSLLSDKGDPSAGFIHRLCETFGLSADWLLGVRPKGPVPETVAKIDKLIGAAQRCLVILGAVAGLSASANPVAPPNIGINGKGLFWPSGSKEHRGWIALTPRVECKCGEVTGISEDVVDSRAGFTPMPGTGPRFS